MESPGASASVTVLGLGSVLEGDDALGPFVVRRLLSAYDFQPDVAVLDIGTPGLELSPGIGCEDALIVVDTVLADGPPGALRLYRREALLHHMPEEPVRSDDPDLQETLLMLGFPDHSPADVLVVGVIPGRTESGVGLSDAVRDAVPRVMAAVLIELDRLGKPARPSREPAEPDIWWEDPQQDT